MKAKEKRRQLATAITALAFAGCGVFLAEAGRRYEEIQQEKLAAAIPQNAEAAPFSRQAPIPAKIQPEALAETEAAEEESEAAFEPAPDKLNLAYYFPEESDTNNIINSYAGQVFQDLTVLDSQWLADLYELADVKPADMAVRLGRDAASMQGSYNPKDESQDPNNPQTWILSNWKKINVSFTDGDGKRITGFSNVKDILAMASVYTYYTDMLDSQLFSDYAHQLWENSHSYTLSMSEIYYCDGCLDKTDEEIAMEEEAMESEAMSMLSPGEVMINDEESPAADGTPLVEEGTSDAFSGVSSAGEEMTSAASGMSSVEEEQALTPSGTSSAEEEQTPAPSDMHSAGEEQAPASDGASSAGGEPISGQAASEDVPRIIQRASSGNPLPPAEASASQAAARTSSSDNPAETSTDTAGLAEPEDTTEPAVSAEPAETAGPEDAAESADTAKPADASEISLKASASLVSQDPDPSLEKGKEESSHANCPGHVDLNIRVKILGLSDKNGLYQADTLSSAENDTDGCTWEGWTDETKAYVDAISSQDWFADYGLSVSSLSLSDPLTDEEIQTYMDGLPAGLSQTRRDIIHFALSSVGRVPYYYGGKASAPGYEGNNFGALVSSDQQGRVLKGLDCSGWINWVYWSVTGKRLAGESTSSLILCGEKISRGDLQPGDIVVRTGTSAHVVMFLGWSADGRMNVIHESSASVNNVTLKTMDAAWPYYRKLTE